MKKTIALLTLAFAGHALAGGMNDDPLLFMLMIDKAEVADTDEGNAFRWEMDGWLGKDLNKFWFKSEGERSRGTTEEGNLELLYSRAIAPFWDLQAGWRHDFEPGPSRDWLAFGFKGLAPYRFEVDATAYVGDSGRTALGFSAEYEYLFTQRLVLTPEVELNLHGKNDRDTGTGSGLSDLSFGLRLRYELRREFAPYIGVNWWKKYGRTADYAREDGEITSDTEFVVGIRAWF